MAKDTGEMTKEAVEQKLKELNQSRAEVHRLFDEICVEIKQSRDAVPSYSPYRREDEKWKKTSFKR